MVTLTELAATKVHEFLEQNGRPEAGLRVRVVGGGCSGFQYQLALDEAASEGDEVFEQNGVRLFVDPRSYLYLDGTEIDYVEDIMGSGFRFSNPNATGSCGCGESFQV
ncbi:MAG TPA: iron-sulfur cluster insertion protein ErpA [Vicinamibacteria bacterium]|nr:iron-sulfur cluster insertion protein ErpA [Vicinamibacteria bacterium]